MPVTLVPATPKSTARRAGIGDVNVARQPPSGRGGNWLSTSRPDHHPDDVVTDGVGAGDLSRVPPVLEHGDAIGDGEHLVQAVADEHDRATLLGAGP